MGETEKQAGSTLKELRLAVEKLPSWTDETSREMIGLAFQNIRPISLIGDKLMVSVPEKDPFGSIALYDALMNTCKWELGLSLVYKEGSQDWETKWETWFGFKAPQVGSAKWKSFVRHAEKLGLATVSVMAKRIAGRDTNQPLPYFVAVLEKEYPNLLD